MISIRPELSRNNVLSRVSSLDIFKRYCPNFKEVDKKFKDRSDDTKPSAVITFWNGDYLFKDFGQSGSYRAIDYVVYSMGISFWDALKIINEDFQLGLGNDESVQVLPVVPPNPKLNQTNSNFTNSDVKLINNIRVKRREVKSHDLEFWESYGWTCRLLEAGRIYPITHFWLTNPRKELFNYKVKIDEDKLAYTFDYYFHKGVFRRKLYFPGEDSRFLSNVDYTVVQGYPTLPRTGDILIVTSSLKDCGPFWRLGYPAIAPNSENEFFYESFVNKLKSRFKRIVIWFDNDEAGLKFSREFAKLYDLEYTSNPEDTAKDPSDFVYKCGIEEFRTLVIKSLNSTLKVFK